MLMFYGPQPPYSLYGLQLGGYCPYCKTGTRFKRTTDPISKLLISDNIEEVVINYTCEVCLRPIPVYWKIRKWSDVNTPEVHLPRVVLPMRDEFNFEHVPKSVKKEIEEALDCLSVNAYNGFAAVCRRSIQAICTDLGADATSKVKKQINEMVSLTGLDDNLKELAIQIMLSGHDGSHPNLPDVNAERVAVLLSLLRDLTYQLYTRPGKIKDAAVLRKEVIQKKKDKEG